MATPSDAHSAHTGSHVPSSTSFPFFSVFSERSVAGRVNTTYVYISMLIIQLHSLLPVEISIFIVIQPFRKLHVMTCNDVKTFRKTPITN